MESQDENKNCCLYVDLKASEEDLLFALHERYGGTKHPCHVDCDWAELHLENGDYSWIKKRRKEDGFLHFRHRIYVECKSGTSHQRFMKNLCDIMAFLRNKGANVVPACDFEDELDSMSEN